MKTPRTLILLAALLALASACTPFEYIAHLFQDTDIPAAYEIQPRPTLVLVDDPVNAIPEGALKSLLAQTVELSMNKNVDKITFIPQQKLVDLQTSVGTGFAKMAVNRVGANLNADQVIYIRVESLDLHAQPGLSTPQMAVRVKVVDSHTGKRLFPVMKPGQSDLTGAGELGELVTVRLDYQQVDTNEPSVINGLYRKVLEQAGVESSELFFKHQPHERPSTDT